MKEVHGINSTSYTAGERRLLLIEQKDFISVNLGVYPEIALTPDEARHVASKLYRIANRIDASRKTTNG
jgi:hypothetical protein